jgi:hypothetical protein
MVPIIPSVGGWIRRGSEATKITNMARKLVANHGTALAIEFTHVAHKPGAMTLLNKLNSSAEHTVKGALFELEYARLYTDEIVEIGRVLNPSVNQEIDFVLKNNVFVNVKDYDWSRYNPFVLTQETNELIKQATRYMEHNPTAVKYVFKGSVPDSVRQALEAIGVIVEVE